MRSRGSLVLAAALLTAGCVGAPVVIDLPLPVPIPYAENVGGALPVDQASIPPDSEKSLRVGDRAFVTNRKTGKRYVFEVTRLTGDGFIGKHVDGKNYRVLYADLAALEVERYDWNFGLFWWR